MKRFNGWVVDKLNRALSSVTGLYIALVVPLAVIFMPAGIQKIENILSSNWLQLWALFVLGIAANRLHKQAKAQHAEHMEQMSKVHKHLGVK